MALIANSYGKGRVRTMRVHRDGDHNEVRELSVEVILHGGFERAYTHADNSSVIATDTIKNVVNIVAREQVQACPETFCMALADRYLGRYPMVERVSVTALETRWSRLQIAGEPHPHAFTLDANGRGVVRLERGRAESVMRSGVDGFTFMKSTASGWTNYVMDDWTTLRETRDRMAATSMNASWLWSGEPADRTETNARILSTMLQVFATTYSEGVQDSLYRMGEAALAAVPEIAEVEMSCPNKHYLPTDLSAFGMSADNLVFTPTDEPHGQIECTVGR
jgi:urate oxidase